MYIHISIIPTSLAPVSAEHFYFVYSCLFLSLTLFKLFVYRTLVFMTSIRLIILCRSSTSSRFLINFATF